MESVLQEWGAVEVSPVEMYGDIFKLGEGFIQKEGEPSGRHKANPIIIGSDGKRTYRRIMFEDTFEELLREFQGYEWAFLNGLTYWGRENKAANQSKMCAMVFDLDGQDADTLNNFFSGAMRAKAYPIPNYITLSGHGVHLYYVFEQPIDLYPNIKLQLKELKYALTDKIWNRYTSNEEKVQHQGINQGFRIAGGRTKVEGATVRAFKVSDHPVWLDYLNEFVPEDKRVDASGLWKESRLTLEEAAKKYPEWYERRVIRQEGMKTWTVKRDLYDWWKRQIEAGATYGHRYFCIMCLAIYAAKCGIDEVELAKDALALVPFLNDLNPSEPFTEDDAMSALECCDERYMRFPRVDISALSGIRIEANRRNFDDKADYEAYIGRKCESREWQKIHLEEKARAERDRKWKRKNGNWDDNNGRKPKQQQVLDYYAANPTATVRAAAEVLGISKTTVQKWKPKG